LHPLLHAGYGLPLESAIDLVFVEEKIVAHFLFLQSARVGYLPSGLFDDDPVPLQADRYFAARQAGIVDAPQEPSVRHERMSLFLNE
jgi:hypothetical protein